MMFKQSPKSAMMRNTNSSYCYLSPQMFPQNTKIARFKNAPTCNCAVAASIRYGVVGAFGTAVLFDCMH